MKAIKLIIFFFLITRTNIFSQTDSTMLFQITLKDESELLGVVIEKNDSLLIFKTASGLTINIENQMIKEISELRGEYTGKGFMRYDPNRTRLLFGPTARSLPAGEGYFSIYELFFPFLAVGINDFIVISGGMSLFPGAEEQILYVAPKIRFLGTENICISGGVLFAHVSESDIGILYGVTTIGSEMNAVTFGIGWGFNDGEISENPVIMIGGELQASSSFKLITENWIPTNSGVAIISFGLRFFGDHLAADFGLITSTEASSGFPFFPWVGFAYNF